MDKHITFINLVDFAYNDTKLLETVQVVDAIENDEETSDEYKVILATKELLDNSSKEPSQRILNKIFLYSKQKSLVPSLS
jgi:hypothetical protein